MRVCLLVYVCVCVIPKERRGAVWPWAALFPFRRRLCLLHFGRFFDLSFRHKKRDEIGKKEREGETVGREIWD